MFAIEIPAEDAVISVGSKRAAVAQFCVALPVAGSGSEQSASSVPRGSCDDIDDAVDGIDAPQSPARSADDLDALDVLEHDVLGIPENAGKQRRVDGAAVN